MTARTQDRPLDELPVDAIRVGKRYRQHMGDIEGLAASIAEHGLMHPIVVTPERDLVAGERRLQAVRQLGWVTVPVRVVTPANLLKAETDENAVRSDFTPSEAVAIARALEPIERAAAKERMSAGGKGAQIAQPSARTSDRLAAAVGMGARTLDKATAVVAAADANPDLGDLVADMDASGSVDKAYRELGRRTTTPSGASALPMTDVHRAKFPELAYADLKGELTRDLHAFAKPTAFQPETWADRIGDLRPAEVAYIRQQLGWIKRRIDAWESLLDRPALSVVGDQS